LRAAWVSGRCVDTLLAVVTAIPGSSPRANVCSSKNRGFAAATREPIPRVSRESSLSREPPRRVLGRDRRHRSRGAALSFPPQDSGLLLMLDEPATSHPCATSPRSLRPGAAKASKSCPSGRSRADHRPLRTARSDSRQQPPRQTGTVQDHRPRDLDYLSKLLGGRRQPGGPSPTKQAEDSPPSWSQQRERLAHPPTRGANWHSEPESSSTGACPRPGCASDQA